MQVRVGVFLDALGRILDQRVDGREQLGCLEHGFRHLLSRGHIHRVTVRFQLCHLAAEWRVLIGPVAQEGFQLRLGDNLAGFNIHPLTAECVQVKVFADIVAVLGRGHDHRARLPLTREVTAAQVAHLCDCRRERHGHEDLVVLLLLHLETALVADTLGERLRVLAVLVIGLWHLVAACVKDDVPLALVHHFHGRLV